MTAAIRYPAGPVTPQGAYAVLAGNAPTMRLKAPDKSITLDMMGGLAVPDRTKPESVQVISVKGLVAPWKTIDQKGASEDGVTFVDALYDPCEVEIKLLLKARDGAHLRRLRDHVTGSVDAIRTSELSWVSIGVGGLGKWWADLRWFKTFPEEIRVGGRSRTQVMTLVMRADSGLWRSFDHVDQFMFAYDDMFDDFRTDHSGAQTLGPNWPQRYDGDGGGFCTSDSKGAFWVDDPSDTWSTLSREVVCGPYKDFETDTDNQVVTVTIGSMQEWTYPDAAANDAWCRMGRNPDGSWNGYGVRLRAEDQAATITRFNAFAPTEMARINLFPPPLPGEKFTIVPGAEGKPRLFKALRNGAQLADSLTWRPLTVLESGTGSALGPAYRGVGFGMKAAAAFLTQATPARVTRVSAGDNATVTQSGLLTRVNVGDQPMRDRFTFYGPGLFRVGNGPDSTDMVEFGPLLPNQVVQLRTSSPGGTRGLVDLTSTPPTPQELDLFQQAVKDFVDWASGNNVPPLMQQLESVFGINPPQGNLYSLLKGRFSNPVPAKSPGRKAQPHYVHAEIVDGTADSKIVVAGTPLRRLPV